ncbi:hypothetical protein ACFCYC_38260 [Streptomyces sp. NPDC056402]|uniref:hypothetical protein n=2 Tax=unclassified Streptomyces TaxID=2593676 RepID=UPI0035DF7EB3
MTSSPAGSTSSSFRRGVGVARVSVEKGWLPHIPYRAAPEALYRHAGQRMCTGGLLYRGGGMPHTPEPGTPESVHEEEPWLSSDEVAKLWPVRKDWLSGVAYRADVRVRRVGGKDRGTWGAEPTIYYFHPGDVHRAAPAIAEGRVDIPSDWRTDTPDGRRAEFWGMLIARVAGTLVIAALLGGIFLILGTVIFLLTVE